eukprot:jgi/Botrbrau1/14829/Bobra.168_3s0011.1
MVEQFQLQHPFHSHAPGHVASDDPQHVAAALLAEMASDGLDLPDHPFTAKQDAAFRAITDAHATGFYVVNGIAGSGKTYLAQALTKALRTAGKTVLHCASTGAAAARLSSYAQTVHSLLNLPVNRQFTYMSTTSVSFHVLQRCDVLLIDEFSMLNTLQLEFILMQLMHCKGVHTLPKLWECMTVVFVGDRKQLLPVCRHSRKKNPRCQEAIHFFLDINVRQARDAEYAAFCRDANNSMTQAEIDSVLGPTYATAVIATQT